MRREAVKSELQTQENIKHQRAQRANRILQSVKSVFWITKIVYGPIVATSLWCLECRNELKHDYIENASTGPFLPVLLQLQRFSLNIRRGFQDSRPKPRAFYQFLVPRFLTCNASYWYPKWMLERLETSTSLTRSLPVSCMCCLLYPWTLLIESPKWMLVDARYPMETSTSATTVCHILISTYSKKCRTDDTKSSSGLLRV